MTKEEFRRERRKWRLITMSTFPDENIMDSVDKEMVRDYLFSVVYKDSPKWYWDCRESPFKRYRNIKDRYDIRLNIENAPNSYPHLTKNP